MDYLKMNNSDVQDNKDSANTTTDTIGGYSNKPTPRQIKFYNDLCEQRNMQPENIKDWTFDKMSKRITELLAFKAPSKRQIELINEKVANLRGLGATVEVPKQLTGGLDGTASKFISELIEMEAEFTHLAPPSERQIEMLVGMYLCPDVAFEDYDVEKTIPIKIATEEEEKRFAYLSECIEKGIWSELEDGNWDYIPASQELIKEHELLKTKIEKATWRKMTPKEFADELKSKLTKESASKLIENHRGVFYDWKNTRVRPEQIKYIKTLESRLAYQPTPRTIEYAVDEDGEIIEIDAYGKESIPGTEYTPMTDDQIIMLSIEEASAFIDQLRSEVERKTESSLNEPFQDDTVARGTSSIKETVELEKKQIHDLAYKLMAAAGYEDDELISATEEFQGDADYLREFMVGMVEREDLTFHQMLEITRESELAQKILLGLA
jgi:hypothetical protein